MATIEQVSADFVAFYYHTFDTNRAALAALYVRSRSLLVRVTLARLLAHRLLGVCVTQQPDSMLTFEGKQFQGPTAILERLQVPCDRVQ